MLPISGISPPDGRAYMPRHPETRDTGACSVLVSVYVYRVLCTNTPRINNAYYCIMYYAIDGFGGDVGDGLLQHRFGARHSRVCVVVWLCWCVRTTRVFTERARTARWYYVDSFSDSYIHFAYTHAWPYITNGARGGIHGCVLAFVGHAM